MSFNTGVLQTSLLISQILHLPLINVLRAEPYRDAQGSKVLQYNGKERLHSTRWIRRSEHGGKGRNQWQCLNSLTLLALHVNRLFMHHFASEKKLVWLAFSVYWLLITNWKKCLYVFLFITLKNHWQERSGEELILSYKLKEFYTKEKKSANEQKYISHCAVKKKETILFPEKSLLK